jgi:drug/metabolite transporter superfamily protein YnfA
MNNKLIIYMLALLSIILAATSLWIIIHTNDKNELIGGTTGLFLALYLFILTNLDIIKFLKKKQ